MTAGERINVTGGLGVVARPSHWEEHLNIGVGRPVGPKHPFPILVHHQCRLLAAGGYPGTVIAHRHRDFLLDRLSPTSRGRDRHCHQHGCCNRYDKGSLLSHIFSPNIAHLQSPEEHGITVNVSSSHVSKLCGITTKVNGPEFGVSTGVTHSPDSVSASNSA